VLLGNSGIGREKWGCDIPVNDIECRTGVIIHEGDMCTFKGCWVYSDDSRWTFVYNCWNRAKPYLCRVTRSIDCPSGEKEGFQTSSYMPSMLLEGTHHERPLALKVDPIMNRSSDGSKRVFVSAVAS
jgi:hypothetical protein